MTTTGDTSYISSTIIDGGNSGHVVTIENNSSSSILNGFTTINGNSLDGGGIYNVESVSLFSNVHVPEFE